MANIDTQINPSASVMIWNYSDRLGGENIGRDENDVDQIILNTVSLISVSTNKSKSQPAGTFEFQLAPTKNWVTAITPGSWCVILMGRTPIGNTETKYNSPKVKQEHFKMLGKIESVRAVTEVDQQTGALKTTYMVTGKDWGHIFNTFLYVDPTARDKNSTTVGAAQRLLYDNIVKTYGSTDRQQEVKWHSTNAIRAILSFWGITDPASSALGADTQDKTLAKALNQFAFPKSLSRYMGFTDLKNNPAYAITDILRTRTGVLLAQDTYSGIDSADDDHSDGTGFMEPRSFFGTNTVWQLMMDNCNNVINELLTDIRFENGNPLLTVYKRVKPFKINKFENVIKYKTEVGGDQNAASTDATAFIQNLVSDYKHVKQITIPKQDVISMNAGTNWRDRYNFIQVNFGRQIMKQENTKMFLEASLREKTQFFDRESIRRDGLMPMQLNVKYIPPNKDDSKVTAFENAIAYKYLAKEWYFDTHKMLNGSLTIIGQDQYIAVGDNILVPSEVIAPAQNINKDSLSNKTRSYMLAHVEAISHTANVSEDGSRSFITSINFVRGIITNEKGEPLLEDASLTVDQDTSVLSPEQELNSNRVFGTSAGNDPDAQKLKGD